MCKIRNAIFSKSGAVWRENLGGLKKNFYREGAGCLGGDFAVQAGS